MKKYFLFALFVLSVSASFAQGSMSDDKIIQFVQREQQAGTSQAQIVTKLMQRGVTVEQIRRLRKKYNQEKNKSSLGASDLTGRTEADGNRLRKAAAKDEKKQQASNYMIKSGSDYIVNDDKRNFELMQREFNYMFPDSLDNFVPFDEGKNKKKIFGRDIFNNKNLSFEPNMNIATPQNYRLGPGDVVFIDIWGASQKTIQETVSPEGTIVVENVGPVAVSGLTVAEANARVRSKVGARYSSSNIKLTVGQTRTIQVQVMGEVVTPGTYTISAFASVFHALYQAGGVNDIGTLRAIKVYRNGRLVSTVDVYDYILNGKLSGNIRLAENDVIVVGSYDCLVNIVGKVKRPMYYEMKKNESLETLLGYAGGFTGDAFTGSVRLIRKSGREYSIHTIEEFERSTFKLTDGDSVTVDSVIPRYSNLTEVRGAVFRPGMYQVGGTIKTIRELIEHAGGVKEDAFVAHAVMHRRKKDRTLEAISVDVEGILSGKVADVPLQNEDVLFIPNKNEMQEQKTLTIYGEVQFPGVYEFASNTTLEDFILQAGGLTEAASTAKIDVARRIKDASAMESGTQLSKTFSFSLKEGFVLDGDKQFVLEPFDEVYVRKSPGYYKQENVKVEGEIMFEGSYSLSHKNQRLSELVRIAGGLTNEAYAKGARLERQMTPEEKLRLETTVKMSQMNSGKDSVSIAKLDLGTTYYVGIELDKALENPGSEDDIVLREGDRLIIPQYTNTVKVNGEVMYPNTVAYRSKARLDYYINQAGGYGTNAKKRKVYVVAMNGTVSKLSKYSKKITPGCEIIVPSKGRRNGMGLAEILSIGSSTASIATMIATIANLIK